MTDETSPNQPAQPPVPPQPPVQSPAEAPVAGAAPLPEAFVTAPAPEQPKKRRTGLIIALVAVVAGVVLIGGGVFAAVTWFTGAGRASAAEVLPEDTVLYVSADIDPTGEQKLAIANVVRSFPGTEDLLGSGDDLGKVVFDAVLGQSGIPLDYDTDVKPWLGHSIAVGVQAGDGTTPNVTLAIAAKDEAKARAAIDKLETGLPAEQIAFRKGYLLISPLGALPAADAATLASRADFTSELGALGGVGPVVYWQDIAATYDLAADLGGLTGLDPALLDPAVEPSGHVAFTLRFANTSVELTGRSFGIQPTGVPTPQASAELTETLPATTALAVQFDGLGEIAQYIWDNAETLYAGTLPEGEVAGAKADIAATFNQLGIDPDTDLVTLFGEQFVVAVDDTALEPAAYLPSGVGIRVLGDGNGILDLIQPLLDQAAFGGVQIGTAVSDDGSVLTLGIDQATTDLLSAGDGTLGSDAGFTGAVPDLAAATFVLYADLTGVGEALAGYGAPQDVQDVFGALVSVGMSGGPVDESDATFTITVKTTGPQQN